MKTLKHIILLMVAMLLLSHSSGCEKYDDHPIFPASDFISTGDYQGAYWPTEAWKKCDPEEVGMDPKKLKELNEEIRLLLEMHIEFQSILVVKDGYIVAEQYYSDDYGQDDLHRIYSCTKSLISAMIGIALERGLIRSVDDKMTEYFSDHEFQNLSADKENISLHHLLTMSAGLEWYEMDFPYDDDRNSYRQWADDGYRVGFVLDQTTIYAPGEEFSYNSGISLVLSGMVQEVTGIRTDSFALQNLLTPLGIDEYYWPINDEDIAFGGSGVRLTPRDMARFGYLYLKNGKWDGEQIVPETWIETSQQKHMPRKYIPDNYYGYQFWVSDFGLYSAVGYGGQWIMIVPEHNLVVVFNNRFEEGDDLQWSTPERLLNTYIIPAIN
ncbi:MAG: serine hydrolase [Bacteroidales bacterium]|nr:serine hydrolase [Bacteroidales bacterium]